MAHIAHSAKGATRRRFFVSFVGMIGAVVSFMGTPAAGAGGWTWKPVRIGAGGWMRGMVVSPRDPDVRFARGDVDNAYRWDAVHAAWVPMKVIGALPASVTACPTAAGGSALATDPNHPNVVLVAYNLYRSADITGGAAPGYNVYRSADGGRTFSAGNLALTGDTVNDNGGERLAIDPNNSRVVFLGTPNDGLYRSADGGRTWAAVPSGPKAARFPRFDPGVGKVPVGGMNVSRRVYCTTSGGGVYRSDDGGATWADISTGQGVDGHPGFATVDQQGNLWVAAETGDATVYRDSRDGVWAALNVPHGGVSGIAVDPRDARRVFLMTGGGSLARSNDGGAHWTDLGGRLHWATQQPAAWLDPSPIRPDGHYISTSNLYMDPLGRLWDSCGNDGIITCTPNDVTDTASNPPAWTDPVRGIEEMVAQECVLPPGGLPVLTVEDETCFTVTDPDTYTARHFDINLWDNNNGLSTSQDITYCPNQPRFLALTTANMFAGNPAQHNYGSYSTDGGVHWTGFPSIAAGSHPPILYGGEIAVSARPAGQLAAAPGGDNLVWIPTSIYSPNAPAPFFSTDGGATWTQTHSFDSAPGAFVYQGYEYLGHQWGPWNPALKVHSLEADPRMPGVFYANLAAGGFWRSADGGRTWTQPAGAAALPGFAHHGQLKTNPYASGDLWFVDGFEGATKHGLWHSTDGGASFTPIPGFDHCWTLALGKARRAGGYPTVYVYGKRTDDARWGIFASFNTGKFWVRISGYPTGLLDAPSSMAASWDTFGLVYVGFHGNSFVYGAYRAPG